MPADPLSAVARDMAALAGADRRAILAGLDAAERERLRDAMRGHRPVPPPRPAAPGRHSDWFVELMTAAQDGEDRMTAAASAALLDAAGVSDTHAQSRVAGRTLLQAASGLLGSGRSR